MAALEVQAAALQAQFGRAGAVAFEASPLGGVVARLTAGGGSACVALQGAQVLSWVPQTGHRDVLWCSPLSRLGTAKAVRGGIPVCWPWFGPHPNAALGLPAHGFVRTAMWHVESVGTAPGQSSITLSVALTADQQAIAGRGVSVSFCVTLGPHLEPSLDVELTTTNNGEAAFELTEALHTYFAISDIGAARIEGLKGRTFLDQLTGQKAVQSGAIQFAQETDRIYWDTSAPLQIIDAALGRTITIHSRSSASTVVWNPWYEKAVRLGDVPPEGFRDFVCVETANVGPRNGVRVAPGEVHRMACRISCTQQS